MRRQVMMARDTPSQRYEMCEPEVKYITPRPHSDVRIEYIMSPLSFHPISNNSFIDQSVDQSMSIMNFEWIEFVYMKWIESEVVVGISHGRFIRFVNYMCLPPDVPMQNMYEMSDEEYNMPHDIRLREMDYQNRMAQLEQNLRTIEDGNRLILPQEEINNIHDGIRNGHDKPIKQKYFPDEIFKME